MRIVSLSEVLPGKPVDNRELAQRFGLHEKWIERMTGNRSRYFCDPEGGAGEPKTTGDLAAAAGEQVLAETGTDPSTVDFLILSTGSPDYLMPATVNLVAEQLGMNDIPTFQFSSGCAGALQGLYFARSLLRDGLRRGLVIGADSVGRLWPELREAGDMSAGELANFALFGDGAGAALVDDATDKPGLIAEHILLRTVGRGIPPAQVVRWYGSDGAPMVPGPNGTTVREPMGVEDYKAIERMVPGMASTALDDLTAATGWDLAEVEHILTPQLNGAMSERIRDFMGVRADQAVQVVADTGNNGNALPFIQLNRAVRKADRVEKDSQFLVVSIESSKWVVSGMALRYQTSGVTSDAV